MSTIARASVLTLVLMIPVSVSADSAADSGAKIAQQGTPKGVAPCMTCHGADGAGMAPTTYPRLAGLDADYMAKQLRNFRAGKRNNPIIMPLGQGDSLSDQDAWDLSAFMNSHERPQDPRHQGDLAATTEQFHGRKFDYYGKFKTADGYLLGEQPASK